MYTSIHLKEKGCIQSMFRKRHDTTPEFLRLMGRLLSIINQAEIPEYNWAKQFREDILSFSTRQTSRNLQHIANMVQLGLGNSDGSINDSDLCRALGALQAMVGERETGIIINDPTFIGKQVICRKEEEQITYGRIESTVVFPNTSDPFDGWVVKVQPGYQLNADSTVFVLYDGPQYQPGEQIYYTKEEGRFAGTILAPNFRWRGRVGFDISIQRGGKADYRYSVPYINLSYT